MKINCLIVDDEPLAREIIETYIATFDELNLVASCEDAMEAMSVLRNKSIDLMFLDIQMPKLTGIEFLKTLRHSPKVIFTTAHREYALEGYELDVLDYLLKPISLERFVKAIDKFYQLSIDDSSDLSIQASHSPSMPDDSYIVVKGNRKMHRINLNDLVYVESIKDYVQIYTKEKSFVVKQQISSLEDILPPSKFIRIHRSYIVALKHIESFSATTIELQNRELPIGRIYKNSTYQALNFKG